MQWLDFDAFFALEKEGRKGEKGGRRRKTERTKLIRKKERKETSEVEETHSFWADLCLPSFLPTSVVDDHETPKRKQTRGNGKKGRDCTFMVYGIAGVVRTTLSATGAPSTALHTKKKH